MPLTGRRYGLDADSSAIAAHQSAINEAIVVTGIAGSIYPAQNATLVARVCSVLIEHCMYLAIHIRRDLEIRNIRGVKIEGARWNVASEEITSKTEGDLWTAVNKIVHARHLQVLTWNHGNSLFSVLGDCMLSHLEVQSDRGELIYVSPFGMAYAYLSGAPEF